jgi:hypothetical protein
MLPFIQARRKPCGRRLQRRAGFRLMSGLRSTIGWSAVAADEGGACVASSFYREHAQGSRELAVRLPDGETRRHLLEIAQKYDALAEQVEQQQLTRLAVSTV